MDDLKILNELINSGAGGFIGDIVSFTIISIIIKKYLINGFAGFLKDAISRYLDHEAEQIKIQTETSHNLTTIAKNLEDMNQRIMSDRNHYDSQMATFRECFHSVNDKLDSIVVLAKKRKEDWLRDDAV